MRRLSVLVLAVLAAAAGLGAAATSAAAATGPDLRVGVSLMFPDNSNGANPIPIDPGSSVGGTLDLDNNGDTDTPATLTVDLTGFDSSSVTVTHLNTAVTCVPSGANSVTCPVPALPAGALPDPDSHDEIWSFQVNQSSTPVSNPAIRFDLEPTVGTDANPADNTATLTFATKASADLQTSITPAPAVLVAGSPTTFTLTVHNAGPDAAPTTKTVAILQTNDSGFTVASKDPAVTVTTSGLFSTVTWSAGDLAAGASTSTTFTVTAATVGTTAAIGVSSTSAAADPNPCTNLACDFDQTSLVTVVAPTAATTSPTRPVLANTGAATGPAAGLGLGLVAAGTVVVLGARRRVRG